MPDFLTLSCPVCTGQLKITEDMDRFACAYCGTEHLVRRAESTISLQPLVQGLQNVQKGVDRTASELAIMRLEREIQSLENQIIVTATEREELESASSDAGRRIIAGIVVAVVFGILPLLSGSGAAGPAALIGVIGAVLFARSFAQWRTDTSKRKQLAARQAQLRSDFEARHAQLARHRKITAP